MLSKEILKKVKLLEISTRKLVNQLFAGEYHAVFKGQGLTFADFREYVAGDDVRAISWNLTAKTGKPFIKRYDEERELTLMLVVDVSGSGDFGSSEYFKGEALVQLSALLSFAAVKNNDRVGLLMFSDRIEHYVPPKKGRSHAYRLLRDLLYFKPQGRGTNIKLALEHLNGLMKKKSTVFLFSDFLSGGFEQPLKLISRKHDLVAVIVEDPLEKDLPAMGLVDIEDAETGEIMTVDTSSKFFRQIYAKNCAKLKEAREKLFKKSKTEVVQVGTGKDFVDPLIRFFAGRHRR